MVAFFFAAIIFCKLAQFGINYLKTGEFRGSSLVSEVSAYSKLPREFPGGNLRGGKLKEQSFVRNKFGLRKWQKKININTFRSLPLIKDANYWITKKYKGWLKHKKELDGEGKWILRMPPRFFK